MSKKITRRDFIKGMGVAIIGAAIVPTLGGCSEEKEKQKLVVLSEYSKDENIIIASVAEGSQFGISSSGNIVDETNFWALHPNWYSKDTSLVLPEATFQEDLAQLTELFDKCNEEPSSYSTLIMKSGEDFEAYYVDSCELTSGKQSFNFALDGIDVAVNIKVSDCLVIGPNKKVFLDPLVAQEYGLEDKREEITGKRLAKTRI